jgi:hypothetical protein
MIPLNRFFLHLLFIFTGLLFAQVSIRVDNYESILQPQLDQSDRWHIAFSTLLSPRLLAKLCGKLARLEEGD